MDCHIQQLCLHHKAEVQKKPVSDMYLVILNMGLMAKLICRIILLCQHQLFFLIFMGHERLYIHSLWSLPFVTALCIKLQFLTLLKMSCSLSVLARLRYPALCNKCQQCQTTNVKLPLWIINKPPCDKQAHQNKIIFHHANWHGCARKPTFVSAFYQYGINAKTRTGIRLSKRCSYGI